MKPSGLIPFFVVLFSASLVASEPVIEIGAGSYRTSMPSHCQPLPTEIYRTADVTGPLLTNQWWSSLVWQQFSQNMYAHPAFVRCDADGLVMGYQGSRIYGNGAGIFGSADVQKGDLKIGHSKLAAFPDARCGGHSDWFVSAVFQQNDASLTTSFGHGNPFVYGMIESGDPVVTFTRAPQVWSGSQDDSTLGVTLNGNHYGLFGSGGSRWDVADGASFTNIDRRQSHFSVAILPDDQPETLKLFAKYAHSHVTDTKVEQSFVAGKVESTYRFVCTPREGTETGTVFALYPHQWKYATTKLGKMSYASVRGEMKVGFGNEFTTNVPIQGVLPTLPREGIADRQKIIEQLQQEAARTKLDFADTYWEGKHLGSLASLSGVAESVGSDDLRDLFIDEIQRRLEDWFTATAEKEEPVFYYDENWGTLIGSRPSYGSDRLLNDHHFHYGYFIRAAAEVARHDPAWAKKWGPMVRLLIRDIASLDRQDPLFPHLRCFDKYAGHSWASGNADFADGNNQESSSESLNAWYGLMLWGAATGDTELRDLGIYLFNTERTAVEEYWFDVSGTNFPADFPEEALGMVWGGKGAFGTWFSSDIDCIHGINWLPFTPASLYMGRHPDYVRRNFDSIASKRKQETDFNAGWGDLVLMFEALDDPGQAIRHLEANSDCKIESGNTRAFMQHWVGTLSALGHVDSTTKCVHPFASVFDRDGKKTHVAYNFGSTPLIVEFSDGKTLSVPADSMGTDASRQK